MILQARLKAIEDMPPAAVCCEKMKQSLIAFGKQIIHVSTGSKLKKTHCGFCRSSFLGMRVQSIRGWRIDPRVWEIEEAPGGSNGS